MACTYLSGVGGSGGARHLAVVEIDGVRHVCDGELSLQLSHFRTADKQD